MKKILKNSILFALLLSLFSCEKEIEVDLPKVEQKIVVEGWIEQDQFPMVILTKSSPYFAKVDSASLVKLLILNAEVVVSDGIITDHLSLSLNPNYFPPILYTGDTLKGQIGKSYYLTIKVEGKTLTSTTTIPKPIPLDTLWFKTDIGKDSLGYLWAIITDPPEAGNCYRVFTQRNTKDKKFLPVLGSVYDDQFFNGKSITFNMYRGVETFTDEEQLEENREEIGYYKIGDTVKVKTCSIDRAHYNFWRTAEKEIYSGQNPFATPAPILSNIKGGLGVWGGYGAAYYEIIIK